LTRLSQACKKLRTAVHKYELFGEFMLLGCLGGNPSGLDFSINFMRAVPAAAGTSSAVQPNSVGQQYCSGRHCLGDECGSRRLAELI